MTGGPPALDPYAPPAAELNALAPPVETPGELASRGARLLGVLIDAVLFLVVTVPVFVALGVDGRSGSDGGKSLFRLYTTHGRWGALGGLLLLAQLLVQWTLLYRRGQTVGKILAGTRVVRTDGSRPSFLRVIVLRTWLPHAISYVGMLGGLVSLLSHLLIFRGNRRCGHDLLAGTKVIRVARPGKPG
jgi:uncharacterized RDD family membrane protein YckC